MAEFVVFLRTYSFNAEPKATAGAYGLALNELLAAQPRYDFSRTCPESQSVNPRRLPRSTVTTGRGFLPFEFGRSQRSARRERHRFNILNFSRTRESPCGAASDEWTE
jgi:hypothetical protein